MAIRLSPTLIMPAALAAAVAAFLVLDRAPAAATITAPAPVETAAVGADQIPDIPDTTETMGGGEQQLPPNHPPIDGMGAGRAGAVHGAPGGDEAAEAGNLDWKAPPEWTVAPNTSSMRLATYRVADATELTVVRAGGSTDANIERWQGQFQGSPVTERKEKTAHGIKMTVFHIAGTFAGGGMSATPGASAESHAGWTMLAAIVEPGGTPYFFKMLGPSAQVDHARASFEKMLDGLTVESPH